MEQEPVFLTRELIDEIHHDQIEEFEFARLRDEGRMAIAQPQRVLLRRRRSFRGRYAYVYHIAESQAFLDGNKRTAVEAALGFLELNGVDTTALPELAAYEAMIAVAKHELDRSGLAKFLRESLNGRKPRRLLRVQLRPRARASHCAAGRDISLTPR